MPNRTHPCSAKIQSPVTPNFFLRSDWVAPETGEELGPRSQPRGLRGRPELRWAVLAAACVGAGHRQLPQEGWELDYRKDRLGGAAEEARETDPHRRGISWAENRMTPSREICPEGKPGVGRGRGVQRKPRGGRPGSGHSGRCSSGESIPVPSARAAESASTCPPGAPRTRDHPCPGSSFPGPLLPLPPACQPAPRSLSVS